MKNYNDPVTQEPKRENKRTRRFIFLTAGVILLSCLILAVCIFGIASRLGEEEEHTPEGSPEYTDETLASQQELREKFGVYTHVSHSERRVTLFSKEQLASIEKAKADGTLPRLSYDEVMYLINDSVSLYSEYNEIILAGTEKDTVIKCDHRDLSTLDDSIASNAYQSRTIAVYDVIVHRISLLDAGLFEVTEVQENPSSFSGTNVAAAPTFYFQDEKIKGSLSESFMWGFYAMAICDEDPSNKGTYRAPLRSALNEQRRSIFNKYLYFPHPTPPTKHPLLIMIDGQIVMYEDGNETTCFPTQKWKEQCPNVESITMKKTPDFIPERYLDVEYISFELANSESAKKSQELFTIRDEKTINRLMPHLSTDIFNISLNDTITPDQPFDYYKLTLSTGILIRIPCDEAYGAIASTSTHEYYTHCISEEFAQAVRDIGAPAYEYITHPENRPDFPSNPDISDAIREFSSLYRNFYADLTSGNRAFMTTYTSEYSVLSALELNTDESRFETFISLRDHVVKNPECEMYLLQKIRIYNPYCYYNDMLFNILLTSNEKLTEYCTTNGIVDKGAVLRLLSERYDEFLVQ